MFALLTVLYGVRLQRHPDAGRQEFGHPTKLSFFPTFSISLLPLSVAWLPVVGNIVIPIAGMEFGFPDLSWFFFSVGLVFWVPLFAIFLYRIVFHSPMPEKLLPTLFILMAPPAVGSIALMKLTGGNSDFARVLYDLAVSDAPSREPVPPLRQTPVRALLVGVLVVRTAVAAFRKQICVDEESPRPSELAK